MLAAGLAAAVGPRDLVLSVQSAFRVAHGLFPSKGFLEVAHPFAGLEADQESDDESEDHPYEKHAEEDHDVCPFEQNMYTPSWLAPLPTISELQIGHRSGATGLRFPTRASAFPAISARAHCASA
jgi:hypothetical protein